MQRKTDCRRLKDNEDRIAEACRLDLNKPPFETVLAESGWLQNDCVFVSRNLHKWVKDEKADDIDLSFKFMSPKIRKDPLGVVLVIGCVDGGPRLFSLSPPGALC